MALSEAMVATLRTRVRPFEEAEVALVRDVVGRPHWLDEPAENALRHALNLCRLGRVRAPSGEEVDLWDLLAPLRERVARSLLPALRRGGVRGRGEVARLAGALGAEAWAWRGRALAAVGDRLPEAALDREVREKALVLVCGGGGGVGWSYLGAFSLLEQHDLVPRLCAGTSMGAILLLFRARQRRWDPSWVPDLLGQLGWRKLFRVLQTDSRYALPAALQLELREALGERLRAPDGRPLTLGELAIPLVVAVTGVRDASLPHDPTFYEHLLDGEDAGARPHALERLVSRFLQAAGELATRKDLLARIYLGADEETAGFDALDAVGFSSALPGVVHYDVLRDDPRMHALLSALLARHGVSRLMDGGLTDNLPAAAAWGAVQRGGLGTRNAVVLALEGFAPTLRHPLWYALEQLAAQNAARNRAYVHVRRAFERVLSPLEVVPGPAQLERAVQAGKAELLPDIPLLTRLCRPFRPALSAP